MLDDVFNNRCYEDVYRRIFQFQEYGDMSHFWIELDYYIVRDKFLSRLGESLDINISAYGGSKIFADAVDRDTINSRAYKVINESIEPQGELQDIYKVTELYGYAPSKIFITHTNEVVGMPGTMDASGSISKFASGFGYSESDSEIWFSDNNGDFAVGDSIYFYSPLIAGASSLTSTRSTISRREGYTVYASDVQWVAQTDGASYTTRQVVNAGRSIYARRSYSETPASNMAMPIQNFITFHETLPGLEQKFVVVNSNGSETDTITSSTTPNMEEWKQWKADGTLIIPVEPELENVYTLFKKTVKYCNCR